MDGDVHLGRPTLVRVRAQPVTDELSEPADGRLGSGLFRVSGGFLPGCPSVLGDVRRTSRSDVLKMAVPLCGCGLGRIARHGRGTRRHHDRRFGMRLGDGGGDAVLVVCTVAGERGHRSRHLMDKRPTSAPSSTSLVVSAAATICPVSASRPMCRLRQDRRVLARRLRVEWSGTARSSPSRPMMDPIRPSVWRRAKRNTARKLSAVRAAKGEYHGCPPSVVRGSARQPSIASCVNQTVKLPRWRKLASSAAEFMTLCCCLGLSWRRSWFSLKGEMSIQGQ